MGILGIQPLSPETGRNDNGKALFGLLSHFLGVKAQQAREDELSKQATDAYNSMIPEKVEGGPSIKSEVASNPISPDQVSKGMPSLSDNSQYPGISNLLNPKPDITTAPNRTLEAPDYVKPQPIQIASASDNLSGLGTPAPKRPSNLIDMLNPNQNRTPYEETSRPGEIDNPKRLPQGTPREVVNRAMEYAIAPKNAEQAALEGTLTPEQEARIIKLNEAKRRAEDPLVLALRLGNYDTAKKIANAKSPDHYAGGIIEDPNNPGNYISVVRNTKDSAGTPTGVVGKAVNPADRYKGLGDIRTQNIIDEDTGKATPATINEITALKKKGKVPEAAGYSPAKKQELAEAGQRGGSRAASVRTASKVFDLEAPELIELREKVKAKNLLPTGGFKDLEAVDQWALSKSSDPDVVLFKKKTKFLADTLQRTIGGTAGGQWAFEVAADILDGSYDTPAFAGVVNSHGTTLRRMANEYRNFGKDNDLDVPEKQLQGNVKTITFRRNAQGKLEMVK